MTKIEILNKALSKMPMFFSSSEFGVKVRECGGDLSYGKTGMMTNYLNSECKKLGNQRWQKVVEYKSTPDTISETDAINRLKSLGYKIYKTIEI